MYVLQVQGWGDDEDAYETVGVYDSKANAEEALQNLVREAYDDGLEDVAVRIDEFELNA
jgi:hypothetical protein